ncbi:hypothetical protein RSAG8_04150, partial [Rhizoctonia solani AG-8 WAC10335]
MTTESVSVLSGPRGNDMHRRFMLAHQAHCPIMANCRAFGNTGVIN